MLTKVKIRILDEERDAIQMSANNYDEIAAWCNGSVISDGGLPIYITLLNARGKQTIASNNQWVVKLAPASFTVVDSIN